MRMEWTVAALGAAAWILAVAAAADWTLAFEDDFESGHDGWEFTDPDAWRIETVDGNNVLSLYGKSNYQPTHRSPHNIALVEGLEVGATTIDVTLRQTGREYGHRDLCIFFGYQDPDHYYYVHLASEADDRAHAVFIVDGAARRNIVDTRTDGALWDDRFHNVRVMRDPASGAIEVYFDDMSEPIMTANDTTFGAGRMGVGSFDDVGHFDNVRVLAPNGKAN